MIRHLDPHLNLFWQYGDGNDLENNITRALFCTLELMTNKHRLEFVQKILDEGEAFSLKESENLLFKFDLQRAPKDVLSFPDRRLVGFSPTGKIWEENLQALSQKEGFKSFWKILESKGDPGLADVRKSFQSAGVDETRMKDITIKSLVYTNRYVKDSRPDGWIRIYKDKEPFLVVAFENKLWDLDPFQLQSHMTTVLGHEEKLKNNYTLKSYADLYAIFECQDTNVTGNSFMEYLALMGYAPLRPFKTEEFSFVFQNPEFKFLLTEKWKKFYNLLSYKLGSLFNHENNQLKVDNVTCGNIFLNRMFQQAPQDPVFFVSSEIGVDSKETCEKIHSLQDDSIIKMIESEYGATIQKCRLSYEMFVRIGYKQKLDYKMLKSFDSLGDFIKEYRRVPVYGKDQSKKACIDLFSSYGMDCKTLESWKFQKWNYLVYLRIVTYLREDDVCLPLDVFSDKVVSIIEGHKKALMLFENVIKKDT